MHVNDKHGWHIVVNLLYLLKNMSYADVYHFHYSAMLPFLAELMYGLSLTIMLSLH